MIKLLLQCVACLLLCTSVTSCSSLQYRQTDAELKKEFETVNSDISVDYYVDETAGLKVRSLKAERPENEITIVFFHGSPSSLSAWNSYLKDTTLQRKANLIALDRPGYGYSGFGKSLVSKQEQGEVMSHWIDHYQLKNVIVVGTSYGGPVAARIATVNDNIKGVVMISPAIDPNQEKHIWQSKFTQWWLTRWLVPTGYRVAGDEKTTHAIELEKLEKDWDKVSVPVIHIHGDTDAIVPFGNVNYTKRVFKDIKIIEIPNKGHEIAWRNPEIVLPYLLDVIDLVSQ